VDGLAGKRVRQRELRGARAWRKDAVFDAGRKQVGSGLLRDGQPLRLNQRAGVLSDAVEFFLQRRQRGPGHGFHIFIIAAMSTVAL
jgi:hypothetical protein